MNKLQKICLKRKVFEFIWGFVARQLLHHPEYGLFYQLTSSAEQPGIFSKYCWHTTCTRARSCNADWVHYGWIKSNHVAERPSGSSRNFNSIPSCDHVCSRRDLLDLADVIILQPSSVVLCLSVLCFFGMIVSHEQSCKESNLGFASSWRHLSASDNAASYELGIAPPPTRKTGLQVVHKVWVVSVTVHSHL